VFIYLPRQGVSDGEDYIKSCRRESFKTYNTYTNFTQPRIYIPLHLPLEEVRLLKWSGKYMWKVGIEVFLQPYLHENHIQAINY
jgi:hypothetical protein